MVLVGEVVAGGALDRREAGRLGLGAGDGDDHVVVVVGGVARAVAAFVVVLVSTAFGACGFVGGRGVGIFILVCVLWEEWNMAEPACRRSCLFFEFPPLYVRVMALVLEAL